MEIPEIEIDELERRLSGSAVVIDVREDDEWAAGHIDGAIHIALGTIPDRLEHVPKDGPIFMICARGGRSTRAVEYLRQHEIEAINVVGGMMAWTDAQKPSTSGTD